MRYRPLLALITLTALLAGCADSDNSNGAEAVNDDTTSQAADTSPAETTNSNEARPKIFEAADMRPIEDADGRRRLLAMDDALDEIELGVITLLDGKVTLELPTSMQPMTERQLSLKYSGNTRPGVAYTTPSTGVNLTISHTERELNEGQIYEYHHLYKHLLNNNEQFKDAQWISNEELVVDGRRCFLAQFRLELADLEIYNMTLGTSLDGRLLLVTFNFPTMVEDVWQSVGWNMLMNARFHPIEDRTGEPDASDAANNGDETQEGSDAQP